MSYTCRILAIDGGGIRGIIPAYILSQIEAALGTPIYQSFDIIAGTSTGGLIALALTTPFAGNNNAPYSASSVLNLYMNDESDIFKKQSNGDGMESKYFSISTWLQGILGPVTLSQAQQQLKSLGNPTPTQVLTTCYTINGASGINIGPYLFNWQDAANSSADDYCVWEAALATSSAPTYFPVAQVGAGVSNGSSATNRWAADGGVVANNPALYAIAWAFKLGLAATLSDVLVVSMGTGIYNAGIQIINGGNWGSIEWGAGFDTNNNPTSPLLDVLTMSNVLSPDQQLQLIIPQGGYYRLEPVLTSAESSMDGTDTKELLATATQYIASGGAGYGIYQNVLASLTAARQQAA